MGAKKKREGRKRENGRRKKGNRSKKEGNYPYFDFVSPSLPQKQGRISKKIMSRVGKIFFEWP